MSKIGKTSYSSLTRALHIADTPVTDTPINHYHVVSTIFLSLPPRHQHVSAFIIICNGLIHAKTVYDVITHTRDQSTCCNTKSC